VDQTISINCLFFTGDIKTIEYVVSWPTWVSRRMAFRSVQPFLHSLSVWPTHRQTDHATYNVCGRRLHAMRPNNPR